MHTRLLMRAALVALLVAVAGGSALAMSSLTGPTGIVATPTAAVAPTGTLEAALTYQRLSIGQDMYESVEAAQLMDEGDSTDMTVWGGELLGGFAEKGEYWLQYNAVSNGHDSHLWGGGAKYRFLEEPKDSVDLAVGVGYWSWVEAIEMYADDFSDVGIWNAYAVATKDLTRMYGESANYKTKTIGGLGVMYLRVDPDQGDSESLFRPFVNLQIIGQKDTTLGLEYRWKDSSIDAKGVFSAVLRQKFQRDWAAEIGYTNATPFGVGLNDYNVFVRVAYWFGYGGYGKQGGYGGGY